MRGRRPALSVLAVLLGLFGIGTGQAEATMNLKTFDFQPSSFEPGGHPDSEINFAVTTGSGETLESVSFAPTVGYALEPSSVPTCPNSAFLINECGPSAQVGVATVRGEYEGSSEFLFGTVPLYALTPLPNQFAHFGFMIPTVEVPVDFGATLLTAPQAPTEHHYQLRLAFSELPQSPPLVGIKMSLWGIPADPAHDADRFPQGSPGCPGSPTTSCNSEPISSNLPELPLTLYAVYCESWTPAEMFSTYQGHEASAVNLAGDFEDCTSFGFNPSITVAPTTTAGHSAAGLDLDVKDPLPQQATALYPSELQAAVVTTNGLTLDPNLSEHPTCSDTAAAMTGNQASACPPASVVGTAELRVAGVSDALEGSVFLGTPVSGKTRLFLVVGSGGLELKLPGTLEQLPSERLKFTFGDQPKLPIAEEHLKFSSGFVRTPVHCGNYAVETRLPPWNSSLLAKEAQIHYSISSGPAGGPCIGVPTNVSVQLDPASIAADGSSQATATVEVRDAEGNGVPAEDVRISSSDPQQKIGAVIDNGDGTYSAVITGSTTVGATTITAVDASADPEVSGSASLMQTGGGERTPMAAALPAPAPPAPRAPLVRLLKKPARHGSSRRARFDFEADVADATFRCRLDHAAYRPCTPPVVFARLSLGRHKFSVRAANGTVLGPTTFWSFRVLGHERHHR
jgi:Invasin, domain 3